MRTTQNLHELIVSLTQTEKAYVKKKSFHSKTNNYLKLFDLIAQQEIYNEEKIIDKFRGEDFIKNFSRTKNYLYNYILDRLIEYHKESFDSIKIKYLINQATILFRKGLINQSKTLYTKALKLSRECNDAISELEILNGFYELENCGFDKDEFNFADDLLNITNKIRRESDIKYHKLSITSKLKKNKNLSLKQKEEIKNTIAKGVFETKPTDTPNTKINSILSQYSIYDSEKNLSKLKEVVNSIDQSLDNDKTTSNTLIKLNLIDLKINYLQKSEQFDKAEKEIEDLKQIKINPSFSKNEKLAVLSHYYYHLLNNQLNSNKLKEVSKTLSIIESWFIKNEQSIASVFRFELLNTIFIAYFSLKEYHKSLKWLNKLIHNENDLDAYDKINSLIKLLICHIEMENFDIIKYVNSNLKSELVKNPDEYILESFFAERIKETSLSTFENNSKLQNRLEEIRRDIAALKISKNINFNSNINFILSWLESHFQKTEGFLSAFKKQTTETR